MLTLNDQTISNALVVFDKCRDLLVAFLGFKNIGISEFETQKLVKEIKLANKNAVMEVVTYTEESCL